MTSVGQKLKDARIAKGLTLDDLQQTTKIQKRYLIAIEEENYDALPGNFYVKAFARQYATTVGLDPDKIVQELNAELGEPDSAVSESATTSRVQKREDLSRPRESEWSSKISKSLPTIIVVVVVVAILGTVYAVTLGSRKQSQNQQIEQTSAKVTVSTDTKKKSKKSSALSSSKETQRIVNIASSRSTFTYNVENAPTPSVIEIGTEGGSSWDAVYVGGSKSWQGTLQAGTTKKIQVPAGASQVILSIGNSKVSTIKVNGHEFNFLAESPSLTVRKLILNFGGNSSNQSQVANTQEIGTNNQTNYQNGYQRNQQNSGREIYYQNNTR